MAVGSNHDVDTLPFATEGDLARERRLICLTILAHPQPEMIGARAFLTGLAEGASVALSRLAPDFTTTDHLVTQPLSDPYASRQATDLSWREGVVFTPPPTASRIVVAGVPLTGVRRIEPALLQRGVVLELSNRTAVLLHERPQPQVVEDCGLVGGSEALETVRKQILRAAPFLVPVLISGETGVGKELVARALHDAGPRRDGPWVAVNVAEIKSETAASVLFGHVRGAFTGASQDHDGLFVRADGGTLFLDEIGEMAPDVQAMLLRVLETGDVQRLGDRRVRKVDVRVVAATDQDLEERGNLRTPLLYRLAGYQVRVPPLRHRLEDLGMLLRHFCQEETAHARQPAEEPWLPAGLITQLAKHKWPGNARELRNLVRTLVIQAEGDPRLGRGFSLESWLGLADAPTPAGSAPALEPSHVTEDAVSAALARNHWNLTATARDMGIARSTLYLMIDRSTALRTAADVTPGELRAVWERASGNVDVMAQMLHVSPRGLRLALRAAGLLESGMTSEDSEPAS